MLTASKNLHSHITWSGTSGATEASALGWAPGYWPQQVKVGDDTWTQQEVIRDREGDIRYVTYTTGDRVIGVWND